MAKAGVVDRPPGVWGTNLEHFAWMYYGMSRKTALITIAAVTLGYLLVVNPVLILAAHKGILSPRFNRVYAWVGDPAYFLADGVPMYHRYLNWWVHWVRPDLELADHGMVRKSVRP